MTPLLPPDFPNGRRQIAIDEAEMTPLHPFRAPQFAVPKSHTSQIYPDWTYADDVSFGSKKAFALPGFLGPNGAVDAWRRPSRRGVDRDDGGSVQFNQQLPQTDNSHPNSSRAVAVADLCITDGLLEGLAPLTISCNNEMGRNGISQSSARGPLTPLCPMALVTSMSQPLGSTVRDGAAAGRLREGPSSKLPAVAD
jgi:hypothetical protein